ncbi:hypothetical protein BN903_1 [Halorubrum sp. AJ67]|nr:hypothetical protein BN903_1 [Halorubrum sp. AJ67]
MGSRVPRGRGDNRVIGRSRSGIRRRGRSTIHRLSLGDRHRRIE